MGASNARLGESRRVDLTPLSAKESSRNVLGTQRGSEPICSSTQQLSCAASSELELQSRNYTSQLSCCISQLSQLLKAGTRPLASCVSDISPLSHTAVCLLPLLQRIARKTGSLPDGSHPTHKPSALSSARWHTRGRSTPVHLRRHAHAQTHPRARIALGSKLFRRWQRVWVCPLIYPELYV